MNTPDLPCVLLGEGGRLSGTSYLPSGTQERLNPREELRKRPGTCLRTLPMVSGTTSTGTEVDLSFLVELVF